MRDFHKDVSSLIFQHADTWIVGGTIRDRLLGKDPQDLDLVTSMEFSELERILIAGGYHPVLLNGRFETLSLFEDEDRIDITPIQEIATDAKRRDFTINAIYQHSLTGEIVDPLHGRKDLAEGFLRACGSAKDRFTEDPVRILRMVKHAISYNLRIDASTWEQAKDLIPRCSLVAKERITAELAEIFVLEEAPKAIRMLEDVGYWKEFIPELSRLQGIVQNKYHSLDVWDHTMEVFKNTPQELPLRLAGLFHDIGKWEVASRECYLKGTVRIMENQYFIEKYQIQGTRGMKELNQKLKPYLHKEVTLLGSKLDHYSDLIQFKRVLLGVETPHGLTMVENGKRHFLGHEKKSAEILGNILQRYSFSMFFDGQGQKREEDLLSLVGNHMVATLAFMPDFRGESSKTSRKYRAAELSWKLGWGGRDYDLQRIYDFIHLWKADFEAGKVHTEIDKRLFEDIIGEMLASALWQQEHLGKLSWVEFHGFSAAKGLAGKTLGLFKEHVRRQAMSQQLPVLDKNFLLKTLKEFQRFDPR